MPTKNTSCRSVLSEFIYACSSLLVWLQPFSASRLKCFARGFVPLRTSATKNKNYPSTSLSGAEATASQHSSMRCLQPSNQGFRFPPVDEKRCRLPGKLGKSFRLFWGHILQDDDFCWQKPIRCSVTKPPSDEPNQPLSWANSLKKKMLVFQVLTISWFLPSLWPSFPSSPVSHYCKVHHLNLNLKQNLSEDQKLISAKPMQFIGRNPYFFQVMESTSGRRIDASFQHSTSAWQKRKSAATTFLSNRKTT